MEQRTDLPALTAMATGFAALGSEARLAILRRLVTAGETGLPIGALGEDVGVTGSVLTHHLKQLALAGLVRQERDGRRILCSVDYEAVRGLSEFLLSECCVDADACEKEPSHG